MDTPAPAVLFDIDGSLVDSNYLHIDAWSRACVQAGAPADFWRIHRAIGMDSSKLLNTLLGDRADELGERVKDLHGQYYEELAPRLRKLAQVDELLQGVVDRGGQVVLATSAPEQELVHLRDVLDVEDKLAAITSGEDVTTAKPAPDVVQVALNKAGVEPERAVMVGDAVWDGQAARAAGVTFIGLLAGGYGAAELTEAGAVAVYDDPADLLAHLDQEPLSSLWTR